MDNGQPARVRMFWKGDLWTRCLPGVVRVASVVLAESQDVMFNS
jgi:hypothetical protein